MFSISMQSFGGLILAISPNCFTLGKHLHARETQTTATTPKETGEALSFVEVGRTSVELGPSQKTVQDQLKEGWEKVLRELGELYTQPSVVENVFSAGDQASGADGTGNKDTETIQTARRAFEQNVAKEYIPDLEAGDKVRIVSSSSCNKKAAFLQQSFKFPGCVAEGQTLVDALGTPLKEQPGDKYEFPKMLVVGSSSEAEDNSFSSSVPPLATTVDRHGEIVKEIEAGKGSIAVGADGSDAGIMDDGPKFVVRMSPKSAKKDDLKEAAQQLLGETESIFETFLNKIDTLADGTDVTVDKWMVHGNAFAVLMAQGKAADSLNAAAQASTAGDDVATAVSDSAKAKVGTGTGR